MPRRNEAEEAFRATIGELATRTQKDTLAGGREVVQQSAPLWRRVTDGAPCGWCAMLASRGPVYGSAAKAGQGRRYHGHCGCTAEPFDGSWDDWEPTPEEQHYETAYAAVHEPGMTGERTAALMDEWMKANPYRAAAGAVEKSFASTAARVTVPKFGTLAEAEDYLRKFTVQGFGTGAVKLRGVSVAHAHDVAEAVEQLYAAFPELSKLHSIEALSSTTKLGAKVFSGDQSMAAYEFIYDRLFLSTAVLKDAKSFAGLKNGMAESVEYLRANYHRLSPAQRQIVDRYTAAGRDLVDGESIHGIIRHEFGHKVHAHILKNDRALAEALVSRMDEYAAKVSGYAGTNAREYFAESFASFVKGETDRIDPEMLAYFQSLLS